MPEKLKSCCSSLALREFAKKVAMFSTGIPMEEPQVFCIIEEEI
jgi:hypothetical protein